MYAGQRSGRRIRLIGRSWNDVTRELEDRLNADLDANAPGSVPSGAFTGALPPVVENNTGLGGVVGNPSNGWLPGDSNYIVKRYVRAYQDGLEIGTRNAYNFADGLVVTDEGGTLDRIKVSAANLGAADLGEVTELCRASWHLDETSGVRYDSIGKSHMTDDGIAGVVAGQIGNAADFNGTAKHLFTANNSVLDIGDQSMTLAAWYKPHAHPVGDQYRIVGTDNGGVGFWLWHTNFLPNENIALYWHGVAVAAGTLYLNIELDVWYLIVAWRDKDAGEIGIAAYSQRVIDTFGDFYNGYVYTDVDATGAATGQPFEIGAAAGKYINGSVDAVHFFPGVVLTRAQRNLLWNGGLGRQLAIPAYVEDVEVLTRQMALL